MEMQVQAFDPKEVITNPSLLARKGPPKKDKVQAFAENMLSRREQGRPHQIQPGIVRINEDGSVECFIGQHRKAAEAHLNDNLPEGEDPFLFYAIAVPSTDEQALIDAIHENAWREEANLEDKSHAAEVLKGMGKNQEESAKHLKCSVGYVSDLLRYSKLPAKFKKRVKDGTLTEEAGLDLARYNKNPDVQDKILAIADDARAAVDALHQQQDEHAAAEAEAAAELAAEKAAGGKGGKKGGKKADAEDSAPAETESEEAPKGKSGVPVSDAVKNKPKAAGRKSTPGRTTGSDVKDAAAKLGVKKKGAAPKSDEKGRTKKQFLTFLAVNFGPNVEDVQAPIAELAAKIEEALDDATFTDKRLVNAFTKCCKEDFD